MFEIVFIFVICFESFYSRPCDFDYFQEKDLDSTNKLLQSIKNQKINNFPPNTLSNLLKTFVNNENCLTKARIQNHRQIILGIMYGQPINYH